MSDIECPYCGAEQEINHDDGYGYEEDILHNQECVSCEKIFTFYTSVSFSYKAYTADCLNDGKHSFKRTNTYPIKYTTMKCSMCEEEREPTEEEWEDILK
ncbi:MAG: hypothetical protein OES84_00225 [Kiritimatiellaceae bacterium]|nr:hypothetical protein [Kiritimatiellaceae bacterium]